MLAHAWPRARRKLATENERVPPSTEHVKTLNSRRVLSVGSLVTTDLSATTMSSDGGFVKRFKLSLALLLSLSSAAAYAGGGTFSDAKIISITTYTSEGAPPKGYVVVTFSGNGIGGPSCATSYPKNLVIDVSAQSGNSAAATALMALMTGQPVTAAGTGTCSLNSSMETMASIQNSIAGR